MSRTKKKPPTGAKAIAPSCRNHGSCPWCQGNRKHKQAKRAPWTEEQAAEAWNAQADQFNQWDKLSGAERDEWIAEKNNLPGE